MSELTQRLRATLGLKDTTPILARERRIVDHYEREVAKGRMSVNTAHDRALADMAGANGHPSKVQRTLRSGS